MPLSFADVKLPQIPFRDLSVAIGDFRFAHWDALGEANRKLLEDEEWSILNASSDMVTKAVGLALDESDPAAKKVQGATTSALKAVKTLKDISKVIGVATATVGLAAAVISKDPGAIAKNAKAVFDAATA